jgi:hypothetical protein
VCKEFFVHTRIPDHFLQTDNGKWGRKRKTTPRTDQLILRNSRLHPTMTSKDLQRDLLTSGVYFDGSTVQRRLLEVWRKAREPIKKKLLTPAVKQKWLAWANKTRSWQISTYHGQLVSGRSWLSVMNHIFLFKVTEQVFSDEAVMNQ